MYDIELILFDKDSFVYLLHVANPEHKFCRILLDLISFILWLTFTKKMISYPI